MIRLAQKNETEILSHIAYCSKAHWGYSTEFMETCRAELSITSEYLQSNPTFVLLLDGEPIAFYTLERLTNEKVELGHFFVVPDQMGRGWGRRLIAHACEEARKGGYQAIVIQSDPNAEAFYIAFGAERVGSKESLSFPGRRLPLLELKLDGDGPRPRAR